MFSWICPKCGRDVPPSYTECPNCAPPKPVSGPVSSSAFPPAEPVVPPEPAIFPPPTPPQVPDPPPRAFEPPPAQPRGPIPIASHAPPQSVPYDLPPAPERRIHPALVMIGAAIGIVALLAILYLYVLPSKRTSSASTGSGAATTTEAAAPAAAGKAAHPYAKYLELTGVRVVEDAKQQAEVQFIVVNHSAADLPEMKMQVTVRSGGKPLFDFPYSVPALGPYESKEAREKLKMEMKPYELPDWQFVKADFEITSSPQP